MTRASIWDIRDMRCGPMTTPASPRKHAGGQQAGGQKAASMSPRMARESVVPRGARLSTIGRIALRERTSQQQHSAALYGGARLWPGRLAEAGCADRPPLARKMADPAVVNSRPQSARGCVPGAPRSASAPRYPSTRNGSSVPRAPGAEPFTGPQRAASSMDCHASAEARAAAATGGCCPAPPLPQEHRSSGQLHQNSAPSPDSRVSGTRPSLGSPPTPRGPAASFAPGGSTSAMQEDLGARSRIAAGQSFAPEAVESLLSGKLSAPMTPGRLVSPRASPKGGGYKISLGTKSHGRERPPSPSIDVRHNFADELVLYTAPIADDEEDDDAAPGLGSMQRKGRAQVLQQWQRTEAPPVLGRGHRASDPGLRPLLLRSPAAQAAALAPDGAGAMEVEWSSLSESARQALKHWVSGQLGGRHCMLVLEQSSGGDASAMTCSSEEPTMSDLKGGAALNVLSGLFAEVGLLDQGNSSSSSSWLFQEVFSKTPHQVLEEALRACILEIGDPKLERPSDLSPEQVNLALRRLAMKAQFGSCPSSSRSGRKSNKSDGAPPPNGESTKIQVWLELVRGHTEGWPAGGNATSSSSSQLGPKDKERSSANRAPEKTLGDGGVLKELGKQEDELEAESQQMSLEALRGQNGLIEDYVIRLVRQRDELKQITKLAEERDSYFILGLRGPDATDDEIKKAYRNLARKEHPDKAGIGNKRRFQAIQQAYASILKHRGNEGGSTTLPGESDAPLDGEQTATKDISESAILGESAQYAFEVRDAADRVAACAHRAMRSWEEGSEETGIAKRRALKALRELTRQSTSELKAAAQQLRTLGHANGALVSCVEAFISENQDVANTSSAGMSLRDRCAIVEDTRRSSTSSAEMLEKIGEATEATLRKVEKASPDASTGQEGGGVPPRGSSEGTQAANLVKLGVRLLKESLARTAAVARRTADEAIGAGIKALDLHKGLLMLDNEVAKEQQRQNSKRQSFDEDDAPVAARDVERNKSESQGAGQESDGKKDDATSKAPCEKEKPETPVGQTPRDQLKSAAKRVKDRHVNLRVKNLRFLANLNEEALRVQGRLWSLLARSDGALLPEISVCQKSMIFDLVTQLLDFALVETARLAGNHSAAPTKVLDRSLSFALALEHGREIAMPSDSRTQALKLASFIDKDLLCEIIGGPFRRRLIAIGMKKRGPDSLSSNGGGYVPAAYTRARGNTSLGVGSTAAVKAWEEAANATCERITTCIKNLLVRSPVPGAEDAAGNQGE
eukprot:TRINITY_DN21922_c0_g1_i1.p1 TRINITY_DN21922_c0_g1~~TRINITY_DN21922_c0_g1_i1.p1  ORF type:complete len:1254 (+),score=214.33 TRINITY_DN21922_c0_g1_i1:54-3815(+)